MSEVKWIKLSVNVFDDEKFDAIKTLPDSNDMQLVWVKLLCLAGKCNESGFLMISREIPYTDEMLAQRFNMDIGVVQRALSLFQSLEMIDLIDNVYMVSNWTKYQSLDDMERYKQKNRERQQRYRERQKELLLMEEKQSNVTDNVKNNGENNVNASISISYISIIKNIISYLNNKCNTGYRYTTRATQDKIKARLNEGFTENDFYTVIDVKNAEWGNDSKMSKYLRPETLFGTKFESYLNQCKSKASRQEQTKDDFYGWQ